VPEAVAAGVADQLMALALVLAVTATVCPTATSVELAVNDTEVSLLFDLLQATNAAASTIELKRAFFINDCLG
jgi:hypothetical protein